MRGGLITRFDCEWCPGDSFRVVNAAIASLPRIKTNEAENATGHNNYCRE